ETERRTDVDHLLLHIVDLRTVRRSHSFLQLGRLTMSADLICAERTPVSLGNVVGLTDHVTNLPVWLEEQRAPACLPLSPVTSRVGVRRNKRALQSLNGMSEELPFRPRTGWLA